MCIRDSPVHAVLEQPRRLDGVEAALPEVSPRVGRGHDVLLEYRMSARTHAAVRAARRGDGIPETLALPRIGRQGDAAAGRRVEPAPVHRVAGGVERAE